MQTTLDFNRSFHNTISSSGDELKGYERKARTQEDLIFNHYMKVRRSTPLQVAIALGIHESSARRAITNLTEKGLLKKTDEKVMERYGKPNHIYQYVKA